MTQKKIFMIGWEYPPAITGGLGVACQGLARALVRRGHSVQFMIPRMLPGMHEEGVDLFDVKAKLDLFSPEEVEFLASFTKDKDHNFSVYGSSDYLPHNRTLEESDIDRPFLEGGYGQRLGSEIHKYAEFAGKLATRIRFDIIHAHDWVTFPAGLAAMSATGKPLLCHVHATEFDRSGEHVNQYVYNIEREAFHRCTAVITVSNFTKNIIVERYGVPPEKIFTVHNAVEFEMPHHLLPENDSVIRPFQEKVVLFLGRLTFQKGPDYFVRAARIVIESIQNVRFVMVGTGDMYHRMIELAADLGIGKYFHYTGFLNREQVKRIYRISDLYVMPSVSEPFGISSLEAMLHGVPVIVSKQSGVSEVIQNCFKVDFWDVQELARSMLKVLTDSHLQQNLRSSGLEEVRKITWDESARKTEEIYNSFP